MWLALSSHCAQSILLEKNSKKLNWESDNDDNLSLNTQSSRREKISVWGLQNIVLHGGFLGRHWLTETQYSGKF